VKIQSKSRKYIQLLDSAGRLFMRYGIKRISVEEICRDAQVSKMTFYRYFDGKIDIAKTMMTELMEEASAEYRSIMDSDASWPEKVRKIIRLKLEKTEDMESEFVRDLMASPYPELRVLMEEWASKNLEMLREDFVQGQRKGYLRPDVKPDFLIFLLNQMRNWAVDPALDGLYSSTKEMTEEMVKFFFYGILCSPDFKTGRDR
jgi:AcrR family transcriptional regulator